MPCTSQTIENYYIFLLKKANCENVLLRFFATYCQKKPFRVWFDSIFEANRETPSCLIPRRRCCWTDSKSTSGGMLCVFGDHKFVPISWAYKKHTSASHSSTQAEVISLDTGWRISGLVALTLTCWNLLSVQQGVTFRVNWNPKPPKRLRKPVISLHQTLKSPAIVLMCFIFRTLKL